MADDQMGSTEDAIPQREEGRLSRRTILKGSIFAAIASILPGFWGTDLKAAKTITADEARAILARRAGEVEALEEYGRGLTYYDDEGSYIKLLPLDKTRDSREFLFCIYPFIKQEGGWRNRPFYQRVEYMVKDLPEGMDYEDWVTESLEEDFNKYLSAWYYDARDRVPVFYTDEEMNNRNGSGSPELGPHFE